MRRRDIWGVSEAELNRLISELVMRLCAMYVYGQMNDNVRVPTENRISQDNEECFPISLSLEGPKLNK